MSKVQTGERTFPIGDDNVKLVRGVHLVRAIPADVRLRFERRAERTVRVTPASDRGTATRWRISR